MTVDCIRYDQLEAGNESDQGVDDEEDSRNRACSRGQGQGQPRSDASGGDVGARVEEGAAKVRVSTTTTMKEASGTDVPWKGEGY